MNYVYIAIEMVGEETFRVLTVRLKECGRSELREGNMAAAGSSETPEFTYSSLGRVSSTPCVWNLEIVYSQTQLCHTRVFDG